MICCSAQATLPPAEFYQPLGNTHLFVAPYAFASKLPRNEFTGETRVAVFGDERAGGGFDLGFNTGQRSELRLRLRDLQRETRAPHRQRRT